METVRKLDYEWQYKVCKVFLQMMIEDGFVDESEKCLRFYDTFEEINIGIAMV